MKTIIAGSRTIDNDKQIEKAIKASGFEITEVFCGCAEGVDTSGLNWAKGNRIKWRLFHPNWTELGKKAGPIRNGEMAAEADALILVWDGKSRGSLDMLNQAGAKGLKVFVWIPGVSK